ncbi:MAG: trypsin-like peptidase domain-containing protein [Pseudomonadota bacterium]
MDNRTFFKATLAAVLLACLFALSAAPPASAIEFENSKFRRGDNYSSALVRAWEKGRSSAKASAFFVANNGRRLLVMTASHVVGRTPVFSYRGKRSTRSKALIKERDFAIYEVHFDGTVRYESVGKFHIAQTRPSFGQSLAVVGYPKGFSGAPMFSGNCRLMPRNKLLHPTFFNCNDLDRWCDYAEAVGKSRTTCHADAKAVSRGQVRQCSLPLEKRVTRHERNAYSTHTMNCAVRLGSSGGPVILAKSRSSRGVIGMPSAVFARVYGPFPQEVGVGVATFSQRFKARARRIGIEVR